MSSNTMEMEMEKANEDESPHASPPHPVPLNLSENENPPPQTLAEAVIPNDHHLEFNSPQDQDSPPPAPLHDDKEIKQVLHDDSAELESRPLKPHPNSAPDDDKSSLKPTDDKPQVNDAPDSKSKACTGNATTVSSCHLDSSEPTAEAKVEPSDLPCTTLKKQNEAATPHAASLNVGAELLTTRELKNGENETDVPTPTNNGNSNSRRSFLLDDNCGGSESGTEEVQSAFMNELENFFRERSLEFKPPKFYGEGLNCLK